MNCKCGNLVYHNKKTCRECQTFGRLKVITIIYPDKYGMTSQLLTDQEIEHIKTNVFRMSDEREEFEIMDKPEPEYVEIIYNKK